MTERELNWTALCVASVSASVRLRADLRDLRNDLDSGRLLDQEPSHIYAAVTPRRERSRGFSETALPAFSFPPSFGVARKSRARICTRFAARTRRLAGGLRSETAPTL